MADEAKEKKKSSRRWEVGGVFIPAGLFIGMGVGWAMDHMVQGMFIGLGAGFLALGLAAAFIRD
jgi:F0F1-type ATP synthase assembly protein I